MICASVRDLKDVTSGAPQRGMHCCADFQVSNETSVLLSKSEGVYLPHFDKIIQGQGKERKKMKETDRAEEASPTEDSDQEAYGQLHSQLHNSSFTTPQRTSCSATSYDGVTKAGNILEKKFLLLDGAIIHLHRKTKPLIPSVSSRDDPNKKVPMTWLPPRLDPPGLQVPTTWLPPRLDPPGL
ncbi:hypothetical protein AOLI_G00157580 [Acnodon oligacanthus]